MDELFSLFYNEEVEENPNMNIVIENRHFIIVDSKKLIIDGFSESIKAPSENAICIRNDGSYQFRLFDGGEENPILISYDDIPLYKYENEIIIKRTEEELMFDRQNVLQQNIEQIKDLKISETKALLANYLLSHPLKWTDGKYYSVTSEKQSLLNGAIASYQISATLGMPKVIKWNASGEECVEWNIEDISCLALAIAEYVEPLVAHQQRLEVQIREASTVEEVYAVEMLYS